MIKPTPQENPSYFSELLDIAGDVPKGANRTLQREPAATLTFNAGKVVTAALAVVVFGFCASGWYSSANAHSQAIAEANGLTKIAFSLIAEFALNLERPTSLQENSRKMRREHAKIPFRMNANRTHSASLLEVMDIQEICAEQGQLQDSIDQIDDILERVGKGEFGEFTSDVYIVGQMSKSFLELEYGIDQPQFERTTHVMNSIISVISALEQLNPNSLTSIDKEINERLKVQSASVPEFQMIEYRQRLIDFRNPRTFQIESRISETSQLLDDATAKVIESRLLATLAVAFHKFNLEDDLAKNAHIYRDSAWNELFGNIDNLGKDFDEDKFSIEELNGGVFGKIPIELRKRCRSFVCLALNDLGMCIKNRVDPPIETVQNVFERSLIVAKGNALSRANTLSHRADLFLQLKQQEAKKDGDTAPFIKLEIADREELIELLTKKRDPDKYSVAAQRMLRKNCYRLAIAYFDQGEMEKALFNVVEANAGSSKYIQRNGVVTIQLCEDVQLNSFEKMKICFLTMISNNGYKTSFVHGRIYENLQLMLGLRVKYVNRFNEAEKTERALSALEHLGAVFSDLANFLERFEESTQDPILKEVKNKVLAELEKIKAEIDSRN